MRTLNIKSGGFDKTPGWKTVKISGAEYGTYSGDDGDSKFLQIKFEGYPDNLDMRIYETIGSDGEEFAIGQIFRFANAGLTDVLEGQNGEKIVKLDDDPKHLVGQHINVLFYQDGDYARIFKQAAPTPFSNDVETFTDNDVTYWQNKAEKYYDKVHGTSSSPETSTTVNLDKNGTTTDTAEIPF